MNTLKKRKERFAAKINGIPCYIVIKRNNSGIIEQIFEKPNIQQHKGFFSGEHIIIEKPSQNHYDEVSGGILLKKVYPIKKEQSFSSKYIVNCDKWSISPNWSSEASFAILKLIT